MLLEGPAPAGLFLCAGVFCIFHPPIMAATYSYLALGDSYTIGESVPVYDSFPYQTVQLLRKAGLVFQAPEIIAKTGWTTGELQAGINNTLFLESYDIVTLLIGVNNQYRGLSIENYAKEFELLLNQAIGFAGHKNKRVYVLSIPDWGVTPYAANRDRSKIAREIDAYNAINKTLARKYSVFYIDITPGSREATMDNGLLASDELHPSGKEYARWATLLASAIQQPLK